MSEKIWFLKRCSLFEQLTPAECRRLESQAVVRTFHRGEIIYFPSEPGQSVLVLLRGRVKIKALTPEEVGAFAANAFIGAESLYLLGLEKKGSPVRQAPKVLTIGLQRGPSER